MAAFKATSINVQSFLIAVNPKYAPTVHRCLSNKDLGTLEVQRRWVGRITEILASAIRRMTDPAGTEINADDNGSMVSEMTVLTHTSGENGEYDHGAEEPDGDETIGRDATSTETKKSPPESQIGSDAGRAAEQHKPA